jgi:hypothetical protein
VTGAQIYSGRFRLLKIVLVWWSDIGDVCILPFTVVFSSIWGNTLIWCRQTCLVCHLRCRKVQCLLPVEYSLLKKISSCFKIFFWSSSSSIFAFAFVLLHTPQLNAEFLNFPRFRSLTRSIFQSTGSFWFEVANRDKFCLHLPYRTFCQTKFSFHSNFQLVNSSPFQ